MKKLLPLLLAAFAIISFSNAQTVTDAFRYSGSELTGTARSIAVGNSMSALGADFSVLSVNPAGLGAYRSSEFVITPHLFWNNTSSTLTGGQNSSLSSSKSNLSVGNVGFVVGNRPRSGLFKTSNFAIGFNRVGNYNQKFEFSGRTPGSITDRFRELAGGLAPEELNGFEEGLAYNTGAIYDFDGDLNYETDYLLAQGRDVNKGQFFESKGTNSELFFAYGANVDEKLLFGFSFAVPILNFTEEKFYEESDGNEDIPFFNELKYDEYLSTSGFGLNFKMGLIYKIDQSFNLGFAFHTPTLYSLTDNYDSRMTYNYTDDEQVNEFTERSPDGIFDYNLKTPWRAIGSMGIIIARSGFVSAEVEWTDYSSAEFDFSARGNGDAYRDIEREINRGIDTQLGSALLLKMGGEWAYEKIRLRAGLQMKQSPFVNDNTFDQIYSAGIGYREDRFYVDAGFQFQDLEEGYLPYLTGDGEPQLVQNSLNNSRLLMTFGFKF